MQSCNFKTRLMINWPMLNKHGEFETFKSQNYLLINNVGI